MEKLTERKGGPWVNEDSDIFRGILDIGQEKAVVMPNL